MLNYDQIYQETLKISAERAKWLDNLSVLSELSTEKYYRILRNLCVDGYVAQTKINDHLGFISVPETGLREFVQFLVNFSIQNTQNLETCLGLLPSISCGPSNIKFVMMLSHNIINHSYELKLKFLYTCGDLIRAFLTHQGLKDDEFE